MSGGNLRWQNLRLRNECSSQCVKVYGICADEVLKSVYPEWTFFFFFEVGY